jgi:aspartyl-tRNA(Asn)/glutamyl-tRNA(Gln) amidotransferase subunit C
MEKEINIRRIAKLARLHVEEDEIERFERDMGAVVSMVEKLPDFEDNRIPLDEKDAMPFREDEVKPSMERARVLQNAPKTEAGCIVVPKIVE